MNIDEFVESLMKISTNKSLHSKIKAKLESTKALKVLHVFEPNGRIDVPVLNQFLVMSELVKKSNGEYIVFISDVSASMNNSFEQDKIDKKKPVTPKEKIDSSSKYAVELLKASGVNGPHVKYVISSESTLNSFETFTKFADVTTRIKASEVIETFTNLSKKQVESLTASKIINPALLLTEIYMTGCNIVICPSSKERFMNLSVKLFDDPYVIVPVQSFGSLKKLKENVPVNESCFLFFEDDEKAIEKKINGAFCNDEITENIVYDLIVFSVIPRLGKFSVSGVDYTNVEDFTSNFEKLNKKDVKQSLALAMTEMSKQGRSFILSEAYKELEPIVTKMLSAY